MKRPASLTCVQTTPFKKLKLDDSDFVFVKQEESPVDYLQRLGCKRSRFNASQQAPVSDESLSNYTMEKVQAIREMDIRTLQGLHQQGESFRACNSNGETLLHLACRRGNAEIVEFLAGKVDVESPDTLGRTVLHDLCWRPEASPEIFQLVLSKVSPNLLLQEDARGHTPFEFARKEHWGIWINFLQKNEDYIVNSLNNDVISRPH